MGYDDIRTTVRATMRFIARVCHATGCKCKSTISYWIPRLNTYAYLCVKCSVPVIRGDKQLKPDRPVQKS